MHLAIVGLGWVGRAVAAAAAAADWRIDAWGRHSWQGAGGTLDAADEAACTALAAAGRRADAVLVTFPPQVAAPAFWSWVYGLAPRRWLLGSTGSYRRDGGTDRPRLTEDSPLDLAHPRHAAEQAFLAGGGRLLRLAGLYDRARNPVRWLRQGRVGAEPRQLNLVHTDDAAAAVLGLCTHPQPADVYHVADGETHTWAEIAAALVERGWLAAAPPPRPTARQKADAFVDPSRILAALPGLRPRSFWAALDELATAAAEDEEG